MTALIDSMTTVLITGCRPAHPPVIFLWRRPTQKIIQAPAVNYPDLLSAGVALIEGGVNVIPVNDRKKPLVVWTPYQSRRTTIPELEKWCKNPAVHGLAIIGGKISGGLAVFDFDVARFFERFIEAVKRNREVRELAYLLPIQQTGSGNYQMAFRCGLSLRNDKLAWVPADNEQGRETAIETRAGGGYAVISPSHCPQAEKHGAKHKQAYRVIQGDFAKIPTITDRQASVLLEIGRSLNEMPLTTKEMKAAPLHQNRNGIGGEGVISAFNRKFDIRTILERNKYERQGNRYLAPDSTTGEAGVYIFEDTGRCYSHHGSDPLNDGHSHDPFSVFCILEHGGDVRAAVKAAAAVLGIERTHDQTQPPPADDEQGCDQAEREAIREEAQAPKFPDVISAADLQNLVFPEIEYLIKEIMPFGFGLLSARPKKGKSYLALNISVAKSTGGCALGNKELRLESGTVLYIAYEDRNRRVKNRLTTIMQGEPFPPKLYVAETWPRLPDGGLDRLDKWLTSNPDTKLVVIDTLGRFKPRKRPRQDDYEADMATGAALADLAHKHNVCILGIYHNRKTESDDPLDDVHGSTGMTAAADFVMVLRRGRGQSDAELFVTGRDIEEKTLALRFHKSEGLWELLGSAEEVAKSQSRKDICLILKENGPMTIKELSEIINKKEDTIKKLLYRMKVDNEVSFRNGKWELI